MRLLCYRTSASQEQQEQLWLCAEYVHAFVIESYAEFYIREDRLSFALIIDPFMRHIRHKDLII
jgi:hypothetical protein